MNTLLLLLYCHRYIICTVAYNKCIFSILCRIPFALNEKGATRAHFQLNRGWDAATVCIWRSYFASVFWFRCRAVLRRRVSISQWNSQYLYASQLKDGSHLIAMCGHDMYEYRLFGGTYQHFTVGAQMPRNKQVARSRNRPSHVQDRKSRFCRPVILNGKGHCTHYLCVCIVQ